MTTGYWFLIYWSQRKWLCVGRIWLEYWKICVQLFTMNFRGNFYFWLPITITHLTGTVVDPPPNKYFIRICRWLWHKEVTLFFSLSSPFLHLNSFPDDFFGVLVYINNLQIKLSYATYFGKIMTHEIEILKKFLLK